MKKFDLITIGSGGGAKISSPAASMGLKVAVIEKDRLGGTCLNRGCIPSKMLIHPADVAIEIKEAHRFDIHNNPQFNVDFAKLVERISQTVDADSDKIKSSYSNHPNISYYRGTAKFVENKVIEINNEQITADKIVLAVGTRPTIPDIPGLSGTPFMTSTEALRNTTLPSSMIIIGGGFIACELGHAYAAFGTKTFFLVRSKLLRAQDAEVAAEFQKIFSRYHDVRLGTIPTRVEYSNNNFTVHYTQDGKSSSVSAQALLIATGITSNADTLDLINTDIELQPKNFIKVNEYLETNVVGIFALGDCIGKYFFRHSVNFEGEYVFDYMFGGKTKSPINYPPMPHAVFTHPQVAGVGATEEELKTKGIDYVVGLNPYKSSAMGMALLSDHGFCKILVDRKSRKILGGHIIGPEASDMIHMIIAYMNMNATIDDMLRTIYIHPALPEIVRNAARKAKTALEKNMRNSELAISIKGLTKFYKNFQALDNVSFEIKRGDFFAFLGPNGAGKTTTINAITGLSNYQSGKVQVFGYDVKDEYINSRRLIGLCAQESNFDPFLTINQLLIYQAEYFGVTPWEAKRRANELLERFQLSDKRNCKHRVLSGGMKKRLLLCRALIHDPEILILDEPTSGCDLELKFLIWDYPAQLNKEGKTIFLTTHYMEEAEKLCKTIGIINHGRIVRIGDKKQILQDKSLEDVFLEITGPSDDTSRH